MLRLCNELESQEYVIVIVRPDNEQEYVIVIVLLTMSKEYVIVIVLLTMSKEYVIVIVLLTMSKEFFGMKIRVARKCYGRKNMLRFLRG